jgi:hypothetical protein
VNIAGSVQIRQTIVVQRVVANNGRRVAGGPIPGFEITVVHAERELLAVHVGDEVGHAGVGLHGRVRKIAPQTDLIHEGLVVGRRVVGDCDRRDRERHRPENDPDCGPLEFPRFHGIPPL